MRANLDAATLGGSCLYIGQNHCGHWVVSDARRSCGGLFANQTEAIRFAMYECQRHPQSVIMLPNGLELDARPSIQPISNPLGAMPTRGAKTT